MTEVNLKKIASNFSGMILFSGDGAVEIKECSCFYIFPTDEETDLAVEGDGEVPKFTTIYKWYEPEHGDEVLYFDLDILTNKRRLKLQKDLNSTKEFLLTLCAEERKYFMNELNKLNK